MQRCQAISWAEMTEAAGSDKSAKANKGFGQSCNRLQRRDGNQLQRKTGPHFPSPSPQRTLFSRRGEEWSGLPSRTALRSRPECTSAPDPLLRLSFSICLQGSERRSGCKSAVFLRSPAALQDWTVWLWKSLSCGQMTCLSGFT